MKGEEEEEENKNCIFNISQVMFKSAYLNSMVLLQSNTQIVCFICMRFPPKALSWLLGIYGPRNQI